MFGRDRLGAGDWAVMALGVLFGLIGVVLTIGGGWLIAVGGSWYYLLAGLGLIGATPETSNAGSKNMMTWTK